jgi:putative hemolysin
MRPRFADSNLLQAAQGEALGMAFNVEWARDLRGVREAQHLRYRIFADEMGATLVASDLAPAGLDVDEFDPFCAHLLVRSGSAQRGHPVIATCRVLTPEGARLAGGRYCEEEFDTSRIPHLLRDALELGRVCVDPAWRNGLVVMAIWQELGAEMARRRLNHLVGCTSVSLADGGRMANSVWAQLHPSVLVADELRVRPWNPYALDPETSIAHVAMPPLLKGYLRCGGKLLGPPSLDPQFNTADFPMMMRLQDLPARYNRHIFKR